jgi:hypothetical protein
MSGTFADGLFVGLGLGVLLGGAFFIGTAWLIYWGALRLGLFPGREDSSEPLLARRLKRVV